MYTITYISKENGSQVRADGAFETLRKATNAAKKLSATFSDVVVWNGQPGEQRAYECDAERFGDHCVVCRPISPCVEPASETQPPQNSLGSFALTAGIGARDAKALTASA